MKVWSAIFNVFAVLILVMLLVVYRNTAIVHEREFQEMRLAKAVEYSAELAFLQTLEVEDLDIGYSDMASVVINPGTSLDIFETMMCLNYNMSASDENKAHIESYIPTAVLACNDGYYIATLSEVDETPNNDVQGGEYKLKWSVKKPYVVTKGNTKYAVTLHNEDWIAISDSGGTPGYGEGYINVLGGLNKGEVLRTVNTQIANDMQYQIDYRNFNKTSWDYKFYLPPVQTTTGVNPIEKPGLLIFMQGVDFAGTQKIDVVNVAGLKTVRKIVVVAFIDDDGNKYYCYESQLPEDMTDNAVLFYNNIDEAARDGYYPHFEYLAKPIDYEQ